ncbi:MAG: Hvo_1808 family surface protein [Halobacteriaceae archaeon]
MTAAERTAVDRRRVVVAVLAALALALAGCAAPTPDDLSTRNAPPDPARDVLGWEGGYWHNETLALDVADGLNETERDAVVTRAMARVEAIRRMEFDRDVPVTVESRAAFRERIQGGTSTGGPSPARIQTDVSLEALFLVGESASGAAEESATTAQTVVGYYLPGEDRIVLVSERAAPDVRESVLAHELVHALQFRTFEMGYNASTREARNARNAVVEGEARYVDYLYRQRCGRSWTCVVPPERSATPGNGGDGGPHPGIAILNYFPYSDGPAFVRAQREQGGWAAVRALHGALPASTEQVITPRLYGVDEPTAVRVPDRSSAAWDRLGTDGPGVSLGMPGITAMLAYTAYDDHNASSVLAPTAIFEAPERAALDPLNYNSSYAAGWDGDRLRVYRDGERRGYVWRLAWDSPAEAREFARGYRRVLAHWGGRRVAGDTWVLDRGRFADAFRLTVRGETVTVVNAPTRGALAGVHAEAG